ncbi:winged helix-turn-helix domain-containing protein [Cupriavidus necator]
MSNSLNAVRSSNFPSEMEGIDVYRDIGGRYQLNGSLCFDLASSRLWLDGTQRSAMLKPIASRLLLILCHHPRMVLRRQFLAHALWHSEGMVVSDNSLNQAICHLRDGLAQVDPAGIYIKTLPRIGYALLASVVKSDFVG